MLQRTQEILNDLEELLDELRSLPEGTLILVEGSKDEASLRTWASPRPSSASTALGRYQRP